MAADPARHLTRIEELEMMTTNSREPDYGLGAAIAALLVLSIVANKAVYLTRAGATVGEFVLGLLPALLMALGCFGSYLAVGAWRRGWARRLGKPVVIVITGLLAVLTMVAAVGYWQTGSVPRLQQLQGLTWDILAPSVMEILHKNLYPLVGLILAVLVLVWLLKIGVMRVKWRKFLPQYASVVVAIALTLGAAAFFSKTGGEKKYMEVIASQLFRTDIDLDTATSREAREIEAKFFRAYHERLGQKIGPRYPDIFARLKGSNVIYLVMESTRAKDVPLYGGSADMPNMMQAREHMILLKNLYSQDPRSTKAYGQLDMGRFSLLSWNSYSNNVPWMFPRDGVAAHLNDLGYRTYSFVDGDRSYDHHKNFQEHHGYDLVLYRQGLNPNSPDADDTRMLTRVKQELAQVDKPFYMMVWPIATHHPYGREYWAHKGDWLNRHPEGIKHLGAADHARYLHALHETDELFGQLIQVLKEQGKYENTVIIVTGDHGEAFGEHEPGNVFHGNGVYEESVHVAGFIYSPKIHGMHEDDRYLRLVDIPATILNLTSGDQYLLNAGRSIFFEYRYDVPIYLFNSWAGAVGIIYDGYKLWHREKPGSPVYLASISEIRADPSKELQTASGGRAAELLGMLNTWEAAMKARTAQLLVQKAGEQPPLDDVIRVYCDDGKGFREGFKNWADFTGLSGTVTMSVDKNCRSLRIAPIQSTKIPDGQYLEFDIKKANVSATDRSWGLNDLNLVWSNDLHAINNHSFKLPGGSPAFDYKLDSANHHIESVTLQVSYTWQRERTAPE